jgi:hypothetical protein
MCPELLTIMRSLCLARIWPRCGLAGRSAQRLLAVIRRFAASHTVIVITHDPGLTTTADDVLQLAPASAQLAAAPSLARALGVQDRSSVLVATTTKTDEGSTYSVSSGR